jgi:hypothetical protein
VLGREEEEVRGSFNEGSCLRILTKSCLSISAM